MRVFVLLAAMATTAAADPITMSATTHGSSLDLAFTNTTAKPLSMYTHVRAGIDHYDWLTVKLVNGKTTRVLHFLESRTKAIPIREDIAPQGTLTKTIDLVPWAYRAGNGELLADGTYDLEATWDTTREADGAKVKAIATAKLVIAAPIAHPTKCVDAATTGVELLVHQYDKTLVPKGTTLAIGLHNNDTKSHCVVSFIQTHEIQSDWLELAFPDPKTPRRIRFDDDRNKSYPVYVELPPGATEWRTWDVAAWALRKRNGGKALPASTVWATLTYDTTHEREGWRGKLSTSFGLALP